MWTRLVDPSLTIKEKLVTASNLWQSLEKKKKKAIQGKHIYIIQWISDLLIYMYKREQGMTLHLIYN